jgi:hypothetical protein
MPRTHYIVRILDTSAYQPRIIVELVAVGRTRTPFNFDSQEDSSNGTLTCQRIQGQMTRKCCVKQNETHESDEIRVLQNLCYI